MGLITGMALSGGASTIEAEGNQLQAHGFRMDELNAEREAWIQRIQTMNQGRENVANTNADARTGAAAINGQSREDVQAMKGGGQDFGVNFSGGQAPAQGGAAPAAPPASSGSSPVVPTPATMSTTLTPPSAAGPTGDAATPAAQSAAPSPSPLIPQAGAQPADTSGDVAAKVASDITTLPGQQPAPATAQAPTPSQAKDAVHDYLADAGIDSGHLHTAIQNGLNATLNSKEPWRVTEYLDHVAQLSAALKSGDLQTATKIGYAMSDKGLWKADPETVTNMITGASSETTYGQQSGGAKVKAVDNKAAASDPDKTTLSTLQAQLKEQDADRNNLSLSKSVRSAAQARYDELSGQISQITNKRVPPAVSGTKATTAPAGTAPAAPAPPAGFKAL